MIPSEVVVDNAQEGTLDVSALAVESAVSARLVLLVRRELHERCPRLKTAK